MNGLTIIRLEINNLNGFIFELFNVEYRAFEGSLFGLHIAENHFIVEALFLHIEIKRPW
jgi:hypothetical protein